MDLEENSLRVEVPVQTSPSKLKPLRLHVHSEGHTQAVPARTAVVLILLAACALVTHTYDWRTTPTSRYTATPATRGRARFIVNRLYDDSRPQESSGGGSLQQDMAESDIRTTSKRTHLDLPSFVPPLAPRVRKGLSTQTVDALHNDINSLIGDLDHVGHVASHPYGYRGDLTRLRAGFDQAVANGHLRVVVVGGSMPAGAGLKDKYRDRWPKQLEKMLQLSWPHGNVTVLDVAIGGMPSNSQVPIISSSYRAELHAAHVVLVDIALNDRLNHPWLSGNQPHADVSAKCDAVEGCELMDALLTLCRPETGIVYFETFANEFRAQPLTTPEAFLDAKKHGMCGAWALVLFDWEILALRPYEHGCELEDCVAPFAHH